MAERRKGRRRQGRRVEGPGIASTADRMCSKPASSSVLPKMVTADDVAECLCTTRKAVYNMAARGQLPPPVRIGRRMLFDRADLLRWLEEKRAVSSGRNGR